MREESWWAHGSECLREESWWAHTGVERRLSTLPVHSPLDAAGAERRQHGLRRHRRGLVMCRRARVRLALHGLSGDGRQELLRRRLGALRPTTHARNAHQADAEYQYPNRRVNTQPNLVQCQADGKQLCCRF